MVHLRHPFQAIQSRSALFGGVLLSLIALSGPTFSALMTSSSDLWNYNNGASVTANTGLLGGSDIRNMFGGSF
ncbi:MAG: hypothetical protein J5J06_13325, partial [Phycisphaerae bacterium]|nr:hypothetical protein [Phycisphaerae bacterium]